MRKLILGILCCYTISIAIVIERPIINDLFMKKYEKYLKDSSLKFFLCSTEHKKMLVENNLKRIIYTSEDYYIISNSGEAFELKNCTPAKEEK